MKKCRQSQTWVARSTLLKLNFLADGYWWLLSICNIFYEFSNLVGNLFFYDVGETFNPSLSETLELARDESGLWKPRIHLVGDEVIVDSTTASVLSLGTWVDGMLLENMLQQVTGKNTCKEESYWSNENDFFLLQIVIASCTPAPRSTVTKVTVSEMAELAASIQSKHAAVLRDAIPH